MLDLSIFWKECSLLIFNDRKNFKNSIYRPNTYVNYIFPDLQPICSLFLKHKFDQVNHLFRRHDGVPSPMEYSPRSLDLPWGKNAHVLTSTSPLFISQKSLSSLELYALAMAKWVSFPAFISSYLTSVLLAMLSPLTVTLIRLLLPNFYST